MLEKQSGKGCPSKSVLFDMARIECDPFHNERTAINFSLIINGWSPSVMGSAPCLFMLSFSLKLGKTLSVD